MGFGARQRVLMGVVPVVVAGFMAGVIAASHRPDARPAANDLRATATTLSAVETTDPKGNSASTTGGAPTTADGLSATTVDGALPIDVWVDEDATWSYFDQGSAPAGWQEPAYDDGAWPRGSGEFGFGDGDESTLVDAFGDPAGLVTAYFRAEFALSEGGVPAELSLLADDGAVVWINGERLVNDNMDPGPVAYAVLSETGRWDDEEILRRRFDIDGDAFVAGRNVIAVEVHQRERSSSDLSFAATLMPSDDAGAIVAAPPTNPPTTPSPPTTAPAVGALGGGDELARVSWPHAFVHNGSGQPIELRGVNVRQPVTAEGRTLTRAALQQIADSGFNAIRVALDWPDFEPSRGAWNETAFAELDAVLGDAASVGLYVILDPAHLKGLDHGGADMMEVPAWVWAEAPAITSVAEAERQMLNRVANYAGGYHAEMARRFAGDPNVIAFDLVSELRAWPAIAEDPANSSQNRILDVYATIIDSIRAVDPDQIVIIHPAYGNSDPAQLDLKRLRDDQRQQLIVGVNDYFAGGDPDGFDGDGDASAGQHLWTGGGYALGGSDRAAARADMTGMYVRYLDVLAPMGVPIVVTEFGIARGASFSSEFVADKVEVYRTVLDGYAPGSDAEISYLYWAWNNDGRFELHDGQTVSSLVGPLVN